MPEDGFIIKLDSQNNIQPIVTGVQSKEPFRIVLNIQTGTFKMTYRGN